MREIDRESKRWIEWYEGGRGWKRDKEQKDIWTNRHRKLLSSFALDLDRFLLKLKFHGKFCCNIVLKIA